MSEFNLPTHNSNLTPPSPSYQRAMPLYPSADWAISFQFKVLTTFEVVPVTFGIGVWDPRQIHVPLLTRTRSSV